jgi:tetratricopeptide (TPR) repeat protein
LKPIPILAGLLACSIAWSAPRARLAGGPGAGPGGQEPPRPAGASLLVPSPPDTFPPESEPAPLIIPGRLNVVDTLGSPRSRARLFLAMAADMEKNGRLSSAIAAYNSALVLDTSLAGVAYRIGHLSLGLGDPETAVRAFAVELARHPGDVDAARELGLALAQTGRSRAAIRQLEMLTDKRPRDDEAWSALGFAYLMGGRAQEAETALRRAIALGPARASEHRDLGSALAALGRDAEARAEFRRAMAMDPKDAGAWLNLGNLERRARKPAAALAAYRGAVERDSGLALARLGEARALVELGSVREAGEAYRIWLRTNPEDLRDRLEAIQFFVSVGRTDVALEAARDAVRLAPQAGDSHLMLGVALDVAGDKRGALAELRRAEACFPDSAGRARARHLIATLRGGAPDSLRALFEADSAQHPARSR